MGDAGTADESSDMDPAWIELGSQEGDRDDDWMPPEFGLRPRPLHAHIGAVRQESVGGVLFSAIGPRPGRVRRRRIVFDTHELTALGRRVEERLEEERLEEERTNNMRRVGIMLARAVTGRAQSAPPPAWPPDAPDSR